MRKIYVFVYAILAICMLICIIRAKRKEKTGYSLMLVLHISLISLAANIVTLLACSEIVGRVAFSVYFISTDWMLYYALIFSIGFCGVHTKQKYSLLFVRAVLLVDSVSMLLNVYFEHAFRYEYQMTITGERLLVCLHDFGYVIHLGISYLLVLICITHFLVTSTRVAVVYRMKYRLISGIILFILIGYFANLITGTVIDTSVITIVLGAMIMYFFSVEYISNAVLQRMLSIVSKRMTDGMILYDADNNCIFENDAATAFLAKIGKTRSQFENTIKEDFEKNGYKRDQDYSLNQVTKVDGREIHSHLEYHTLYDEKNKYTGCFFSIEDRTEEVERLLKAQYEANHDDLTGLYDKEYFEKRVREQLAADPDETYMMVCSDIHEFKLINDVFGTKAGDNLLIRIADAIRKHARPWSVYGRLGSDKFAIIVKKKDFVEETFARAPRNVEYVEADTHYPVCIYVGVYEITEPELPVSVMCDRAFMAITTIEGQYERRVAYYTEELRENGVHEKQIAGELEEAIADGQFALYLQPQITAAGKALGAEALVRWLHPAQGLLPPGMFIPTLEKNGLIAKLDLHIWEMACRQLRKWKDEGRENLYLSVNISPKDMYFMDICDVISALVEKYDILPGNLKLEFTETAVATNIDMFIKLIERLHAKGFVVEMDDFGSGYSSLNMLKDIKMDVIKIDMAFLGRTDEKERARKILTKVVELSEQLEMPVIVEGVETGEQVEFLQRIGCETYQGYYFAKPMPIENFEEKYLVK